MLCWFLVFGFFPSVTIMAEGLVIVVFFNESLYTMRVYSL